MLSHGPVSVRAIGEEPGISWETIKLAEGDKGPIMAEGKVLRCYSSPEQGF